MERNWVRLSADDWAKVPRDELEMVEGDEEPWMAFAARVVELAGFETKEYVDSTETDNVDTMEWRGRKGTIPLRFSAPRLDMQAKVDAGQLLYIFLGKGPGGGDEWASQDERFVNVMGDSWVQEHAVPSFRALPADLQSEIARGMDQHEVRVLSFEGDEGIRLEMPWEHLYSLDDPVRQVAGILTFLGHIATLIHDHRSKQQGAAS